MGALSSGKFILYYSIPAPQTSEEINREEQFDDIVDALTSAWLVAQEGGNPTHLIHDDAALFYGDDLKEVLNNISTSGAQQANLREVVRKDSEVRTRAFRRDGLIQRVA
jgi:hypothetical protein